MVQALQILQDERMVSKSQLG